MSHTPATPHPVPFDELGEPPQSAPPVTRRTVTFGVSLLASSVLLAAMVVLPAPYAIRMPGPTQDTLGTQDGRPLITIDGAPTYDPTGQLRLTTVSVAGGPGYPVNAYQVFAGWLDSAQAVRPVEETFPRGQTREESAQLGQDEMISSQENATVAALTELGHQVPATLTVVGTVSGTGAAGVLRDGDIITALDGTPIVTYQDLVDVLAATTPGTSVDVGVQRAGTPEHHEVTTGDGGSTAVLGVLISPEFDYPIDVQITIDDVGGPSAGTMFALGIIDKLTPQDEANGIVIAGTGTMDVSGQVGAIGGISQKMRGALRDGATWFLAPQANCEDVAGHIPAGLTVVRVATLAEARAAVEAIGSGVGDDLPTCS